MKPKIKSNILRKKTRACVIFGVFLFLATTATNAEQGPIFSRNQILNQYIFFRFYPLRAGLPTKKFKLVADLSHSNIIRLKHELTYRTESDMAVTHLTLNPFFRLSANTEVSINTGILSYWGGFLDHFVERYHKLFNFPNGQRAFRSKNESTWVIGTSDWKVVDRHKPTTSLRDTSIMLRYRLINTQENHRFRNFVLTLAAAIELPAGKTDLGTSNGSVDGGIGLYLEKELFSPRIFLYNLTSLCWPGKLERNGHRMPLKKFLVQNSFSVEFIPTSSLSLVAQIQGSTSPYNKTDNKFLDVAPWQFLAGINFLKKRHRMWQLSFSEDISHKTTPDFTFQLTTFQEF